MKDILQTYGDMKTVSDLERRNRKKRRKEGREIQ